MTKNSSIIFAVISIIAPWAPESAPIPTLPNPVVREFNAPEPTAVLLAPVVIF